MPASVLKGGSDRALRTRVLPVVMPITAAHAKYELSTSIVGFMLPLPAVALQHSVIYRRRFLFVSTSLHAYCKGLNVMRSTALSPGSIDTRAAVGSASRPPQVNAYL